MTSTKSLIEELEPTFWFAVVVLMAAAAGTGCNDHLNNDHQGNGSAVRVSSVGQMSLLTSETAGAEDDFGPAASDAVYDFTFTGGIAIVTASQDLEVDGQGDVEVWEVPTEKVTEYETLIRTYITYDGWVPDLFPSSYGSAGDLKAMLTAFACADGIDLPEYSPYECPSNYIPDSLFRRVGDGYYYWQHGDATKVVFLVRR